MQVVTLLRKRKPILRDQYGKILEGLPGSKGVARRKRDVKNLGDPCTSCKPGRAFQQNEECLIRVRESDRFIVL